MPSLCEVCSKEPSKYKCPACGLMRYGRLYLHGSFETKLTQNVQSSCSLGCTKSHKIYCAPKQSLTVAKTEEEKQQQDPGTLQNGMSKKEPIKIQDLGSSPELQKLFEEYPGLRERLREIYKSTLEEEWESEPMGGRNHRGGGGGGGHKRALWTAEKGFRRGLGHVTKWRENCEDGESTGSDAEGFMKFIALVAGSSESPS